MVIDAQQIRPGDVVEYGGERHRVTEIRCPCGAAWPIALDGAGWAIALGRQPVVVERDLAAPRAA